MAGKFDGMLICSDFDGTLYVGGNISDENVEAIRYFQENGGYFTIASGRYPTFLAKHSHRVCANTYLIGLNGAMISSYDGIEQLRQGFLQEEAKPLIRQIVRSFSQFCDMSIFSQKLPKGLPACCHCHEKEGYFRCPLADISDELLALTLSETIYKIVFHTYDVADDSLTEAVRSMAGEGYEISRSWSRGIELQNIAFTKGKSARALAEHLGVHTLICVGDYENDISMVQEADLGCAVEDAVPTLKRVADLILPPAASHAFPALIRHLEQRIG